MSRQGLMVYGASGYTAKLIAELAHERGMKLVLAGRRLSSFAADASRLGFEARELALDDPAALRQGLDGISVVLNCAGPFIDTFAPMVRACLQVGAHYLDITGELEVFEAASRRDAQALTAGVVVLPGVGFDVVPSDCLAAHLKQRLPDATKLTLAFTSTGRPSRGTATTMVRNLGDSGWVRRGGRLVPVPLGKLTREIDFGEGGCHHTVAIPWGDVSTAFHSTQIPDIEVYTRAPKAAALAMRAGSRAKRLLGSPWVQSQLLARVARGPAGPSDDQRARGKSWLYGEVVNAAGERRVSRLTAPEGYTLTADAALKVAERVLRGEASPGFQTPSRAFGADFVLELEGVRREDE
ncbi:MAG: saccharopine dehydrogenase NADP-binding domain-containing protein [Polyangiaceae bacterium]|nr:saccharopine dehydrogenase NADP-binding domain-containing protein [Polyangiaceae bacterium]MCW5789862.1 saccharopine dehydrogenase NADP-binding domain-containing protein [Polyangiaceae bacterium]